jgi:propionyl-CoA carboxylase alpha chain
LTGQSSWRSNPIFTNIDFANQVLTHPVFIKGELSTDFIPTHLLDAKTRIAPPAEVLIAMAMATTLIYHLRENLVQMSLLPLKAKVGASSSSKPHYDYVANEHIFHNRLENKDDDLHWLVRVDDTVYLVTIPPMEFYRRRLKLNIDGEDAFFRLKYSGNFIEAAFCGITSFFESYNTREWALAGHMPPPSKKVAGNILDCPMPGLVVDIKVKAGERVFRGQELVILESMKMESAVSAPADGVVESVCVKQGDAVEKGTVLVHFKKD